jgi:hypothetical protein
VQSDFDVALRRVLEFEGGKVDDPNDKGGRTNRGITQRTYDGWRRDQSLPPRDVWELEDAELRAIYRNLYWWPAKDLTFPLNLVVFDSAVLFGPSRAAGWLAAASWHPASPEAQAWAILCMRRDRHRENVAKDPSQKRFLNGWMNRLEGLAEAVFPKNGKQGGDRWLQPVTGEQIESLAKVDVASSTLVSRSNLNPSPVKG